MTITGDQVEALKCSANPPVKVTYTLGPTSMFQHFQVVENGTIVGGLLREDPHLTLAIKGEPRLVFERQGRRDEHALAYGILFIIIVLSAAIYYTKF